MALSDLWRMIHAKNLAGRSSAEPGWTRRPCLPQQPPAQGGGSPGGSQNSRVRERQETRLLF
jgi:hypothetical protein